MAYLCYSFFGLFKLCKRFCKRSRHSVNTFQSRPDLLKRKEKTSVLDTYHLQMAGPGHSFWSPVTREMFQMNLNPVR